MGFYVRKSLKAGPFRFNLSNSGVGVSVGVPGFRVGTGPRGNYVSMGSAGLSYRATSGSAAGVPLQPGRPTAYTPIRDSIVMEDVTGADVHDLHPTGNGDIVDQLNAAAARWPLGWGFTIIVFIAGAASLPGGLIIWLLAIPAAIWLFLRDKARKSVVLFYDVADADERWFESVVEAATVVASSQRIWRVVQTGQIRTTHQHKTNAGAGNLVNRIPAKFSFKGPKHLVTNISVPSITAGKVKIHFLPDRLLIVEGRHYTDVAYSSTRVTSSTTRFIEEARSNLPRDAQKVGETWQYVNVKGGPDRRFSNNPVLPVMLYGEMEIASASGFRWKMQSSLSMAPGQLRNAISSAPHHP
jgi:hypothetical protein